MVSHVNSIEQNQPPNGILQAGHCTVVLIVETQWTLDPCCWQNQPTKYQNQFNQQQYYMRCDGAGVKWCYQANHSQYFFDELVAVKYTVVYNK